MRLRIPAILCALVALATPAAAAHAASVSTDRGCYAVGQKVTLRGSGFGPGRVYLVTLDDVLFGGQVTNSSGGFTTSPFGPGGLSANYAQFVHQLVVSDGSLNASTTFTVTRSAGARFLAAKGNPNTLTAPFEIWGFSMSGARLPLYLHYVGPSGAYKTTVSLGRAGGQCGYLKTKPRRVFPFTPSRGSWTLQIDTHRGYSRHPSGPVARIGVGVA